MGQEAEFKKIERDVERISIKYKQQLATFEKAAQYVASEIKSKLSQNSISFFTSYRAKNRSSLEKKLQDKLIRNPEKYKFEILMDDIGSVVYDLAACRVILYDPSEVQKAVDVIKGSMLDVFRFIEDFELKDSSGGYRAYHSIVQIYLPKDDSLDGVRCEIQVVSLADHLFNELEHDIVYKTGGVPPSKDEMVALEDLRYSVRIANNSAKRLLQLRKNEVLNSKRVIDDAGYLKFYLEGIAGKPLTGDFEIFYKLLQAVATDGIVGVNFLSSEFFFTKEEINRILERGKAKVNQRGIQEGLTDVLCFIAEVPQAYEVAWKEAASQSADASVSLKRVLLVETAEPTPPPVREEEQ